MSRNNSSKARDRWADGPAEVVWRVHDPAGRVLLNYLPSHRAWAERMAAELTEQTGTPHRVTSLGESPAPAGLRLYRPPQLLAPAPSPRPMAPWYRRVLHILRQWVA